MDGRPPRSLVQPALLLGAGFLWAWFPLPTAAALVWAYLALVLVAGLLRGRGIGGDVRLPWPFALPVALVLLGPFVWALEWHAPAMWAYSQLEGLEAIYRDRARGQRAAALHPPLVRGDRPQVLWLRLDAEPPLSLELGAGGPRVPAVQIGPGVWRAAYDPRQHGPPPAGPILVSAGDRAIETVPVVSPRVRPSGLVAVPGGGALAVSEDTDELLHVDPRGALHRYPVQDGPIRAVALSSTVGAVAHRFSPDLHLYALETGAPLGARPAGADLVDVAGRAGEVAVVARAPDRLQSFLPSGDIWQVGLPFSPRRIFAGEAAGAWYVEAEVEAALYRVTRDGLGRRVPLGRPVYDARVVSGCLEVLVPDLRPREDPGPNHHVEDQRVTVCPGRAPRGAPTFAVDEIGHVIGGAGPRAISPEGGIAFTGTDEIELPDLGRVTSPVFAPSGIARIRADAWAVSSAAAGAIAIVDTQGVLQRRHDLARPGEDARRRGERAFLEATRSGAACETCHFDADSDRGLHDIGHPTARPTLSVRGVAGTAPFLRVASYPDLSGLDGFARTILGGYRRHSETRAADLVAFVEGLPPLSPRRRLSPPEWRAGWRAFATAGCPSCHRPPAFTTRAQYPQHVLFVGQPAGVLLDTPSLLGVSASAPYLYDGRAPTLAALFEDHDPAARHGRFDALSPSAQADLLRFLEAL